MARRAITRDNLGAWLVKASPDSASDLPAATTAGQGAATRWCVVPGYRAEMMTPGDRIVLWVSGDGRRMARGIWGTGRVSGRAEIDGDVGPDPHQRGAVRLSVAADITLFDRAVEAGDLIAAGIDDLEVQRLAQGSNPSWVSRDQWERLRRLLPEPT